MLQGYPHMQAQYMQQQGYYPYAAYTNPQQQGAAGLFILLHIFYRNIYIIFYTKRKTFQFCLRTAYRMVQPNVAWGVQTTAAAAAGAVPGMYLSTTSFSHIDSTNKAFKSA